MIKRKFKVLRDKTSEMYGVFLGELEIGFSYMPQLLSEVATMESLKYLNRDSPRILKQLDDFDLIEVTLIEKPQDNS